MPEPLDLEAIERIAKDPQWTSQVHGPSRVDLFAALDACIAEVRRLRADAERLQRLECSQLREIQRRFGQPWREAIDYWVAEDAASTKDISAK